MPLAFNGFPATYPQMYPQYPGYQQMYQQQPAQIPQQQSQEQKAINGFDWVLGSEGAASYIVPAGKTFILFDASPNSEHFFLKSSDLTGKPSPAIMFDYCEHKEEQKKPEEKPVIDLSGCVKKEDLEPLRKDLQKLMNKPEPETLTHEDVREIVDQIMNDRFAQLTGAAHEPKTRKKEA